MALTPKQERFVAEYLIDLNATQAAIRAGYSEKTANEQGCRLLANVNIQEALSVTRVKIEKRTEITQDYVLSRLVSVVERCMEAEPVLDADGNPTGVFKFNPQGANKALELLGKYKGMFTDNLKIDLQGDLRGMTEEQLVEWIAKHEPAR